MSDIVNEALGMEPQKQPLTDAIKAKANVAVESMKEAWDNFKIGDGHASAMARLGGHELTHALAAFPDSNMRPMEEPGVFGNNHMPQHNPEMDADLKQAASRGGVHGREEEMVR